jgi:hypothetical protein
VDKPGRVAAFEVMINTPSIAALIRDNKTFRIQSDIQTGSKYGMVTLDSFLMDKYAEGLIAREEVITKSQDPTTVQAKLEEMEQGLANGGLARNPRNFGQGAGLGSGIETELLPRNRPPARFPGMGPGVQTGVLPRNQRQPGTNGGMGLGSEASALPGNLRPPGPGTGRDTGAETNGLPRNQRPPGQNGGVRTGTGPMGMDEEQIRSIQARVRELERFQEGENEGGSPDLRR